MISSQVSCLGQEILSVFNFENHANARFHSLVFISALDLCKFIHVQKPCANKIVFNIVSRDPVCVRVPFSECF